VTPDPELIANAELRRAAAALDARAQRAPDRNDAARLETAAELLRRCGRQLRREHARQRRSGVPNNGRNTPSHSQNPPPTPPPNTQNQPGTCHE